MRALYRSTRHIIGPSYSGRYSALQTHAVIVPILPRVTTVAHLQTSTCAALSCLLSCCARISSQWMAPLAEPLPSLTNITTRQQRNVWVASIRCSDAGRDDVRGHSRTKQALPHRRYILQQRDIYTNSCGSEEFCLDVSSSVQELPLLLMRRHW